MTNKEILNLSTSIADAIENNRIKLAINDLKKYSQSGNYHDLTRKIDNIEETYKYLCEYLLNGLQDAGRGEMIRDIKERLRMVNDELRRNALSIDSSDYYYSTLRFNKLRKEHVSELLSEYGRNSSELSLAEAAGEMNIGLRKRNEELLERLFNTLYTSFGSEIEYSELQNYLLSGYADSAVSSQALSAITIGLMEYYDRSKLTMLIEVFENSSDARQISRAAAGILMAMYFWSDRIGQDNRLKARMSLWQDSENFNYLRRSVRAIIGTRDTKLVANKMKDEVLPELMKLRPEILKSLREGNFDMSGTNMEDNPEWEEMLEKSGINSKLQELSELQGEGADVLMLTFSNLKQFTFFNSASNWFLPFDINNTNLELDEDSRKFVSALANAGIAVCDSDLYSLALAVKMMPELQKQMIRNQMNQYLDQLQEVADTELDTDDNRSFKFEVVKVVRDMYRFFKLFRKRNGMKDPFDRSFNFMSMPIVGEMLSDNEMLNIISAYYFKRGFYVDALPIYDILCDRAPDDATLWEKKGFCHQSSGDLLNAKIAYEKAALLKQAGPWLTKKLAFVNRKLGNFAEATDYYLKALDMDPENLSLIMNVGNSMLSEDNIGGALQQFYHANYLSPGNTKVKRALAWVELLNGNITKSRDYYAEVISAGAKKSDYLNAGHVELLLGNFKEAINFYRLSARENKSEFEKSYLADIEVLERMGIDRVTATVVLDMV